MPEIALIQLRVDKRLKLQVQHLCLEQGLTLTDLITSFLIDWVSKEIRNGSLNSLKRGQRET